MRIRWVVLSGTAVLAGALLGTMLAPTPGNAVAKEIIQLQRDVSLLLQAQRDLQRSVDEKHAVLKTLVEQQLDTVGRLNGTMGALQKAVQDVQANSGARMDTLATQVQALGDNFEEVKVRMGRLAQQMSEMQGVMQSLDAKLAGGAPMPGSQAAPPPESQPPASAENLYTNALRDYQGAKYDLARQEFLDYLKFFPETDLAGNAQFYLGEIYFAQKQFNEAIADYDKVLDGYPKSFKLADARYKKGMALLELGQRSGALREFREVVRRHPGTEAERRSSAKVRELTSSSRRD